jgi:dinuclear metal center YbgI/SA1388 family protein
VLLSDLVAYLDGYLRVREIPDHPNAVNGLQVENSGSISRLVAAVDASQASIDAAVRGGAGAEDGPPLILVHHGLFWDGTHALTGRAYRRVASLLAHDAAVYAAHIPLDVHPEVGNNIVLAHELGLREHGWFGDYCGIALGVSGLAPDRLRQRASLVRELERLLGLSSGMARLVPGGPEEVRLVGVVTGSGASALASARDLRIDTLITGEGTHHTYFDAMEWGLNLIYAGHYATETLGVQALARHLAEHFALPWEFQDHPTGM